MKLRGWITLAAGLAAIVPAHAQQYPSRPVRVIVPFAAGSTSDTVMRILQSHFAEAIGQSVVIEDRAGAGGNIGTEVAARAAPDGYTILLGNIAQTVSVSLYRKLNYDFAKDFIPVTQVAAGSYMMAAHPSLPVKTVKEFIALAKKRPGEINAATAGATIRLCAKLLDSMAGTKMTEVQYKSSPFLITALVAGEASVGFPPTGVAMPHVRTGKVRPIAVTSAKRSPIAPQVPTVGETLKGYDVTAWYGMLVPAGTPKNIVDRIRTAAHQALKNPDVQKRYTPNDLDPSPTTSEEFGAMIRADIKKWAKVINESGMRVD